MTFDLYRYDISDLNLESDLELFRFIHATNRLKPKISPDKLDQLCIKSKKSNILYQFWLIIYIFRYRQQHNQMYSKIIVVWDRLQVNQLALELDQSNKIHFIINTMQIWPNIKIKWPKMQQRLKMPNSGNSKYYKVFPTEKLENIIDDHPYRSS